MAIGASMTAAFRCQDIRITCVWVRCKSSSVAVARTMERKYLRFGINHFIGFKSLLYPHLHLCLRLGYGLPYSFEMLQESTSSHNLPHGSTSTSSSYAGGSGYGDKYFDHQLLPNHLQGYSSKSSDIASPTHSIHTPQSQKKKMSPDAAPAAQYNYAQQQHQQRSAQRSGGGAAGTGAPAGKSYGGGTRSSPCC